MFVWDWFAFDVIWVWWLVVYTLGLCVDCLMFVVWCTYLRDILFDWFALEFAFVEVFIFVFILAGSLPFAGLGAAGWWVLLQVLVVGYAVSFYVCGWL